MQRGAQRFFADVPELDERVGTAIDHLRTVMSSTVVALERHPDFLRLLIAACTACRVAGLDTKPPSARVPSRRT